MTAATALNQTKKPITAPKADQLDAESLFDWLGLRPGQKLVATRINADTGVLNGLRIRLQQTVDGRQIAISLDSYAVTPQTGAQTDPVLRLSFGQSRDGAVLKLRQVQWRHQRIALDADKLDSVLADVARISQSLRRQYLPAITSLEALVSASVTEKEA